MKTLATHSFPARESRSPCTALLRSRDDADRPYVTHWRNDEFGGHVDGGYHETYAEGRTDFHARVEREIESQREANPDFVRGPFTVEIWGSRKELGNDDLWVGDTVADRGEAFSLLRDLVSRQENRSSGWGQALVLGPDGSVVHDEINPVAPIPSHDEELDRNERANLAGMEGGVDAYNEALGQEVEEPSFRP